jgi:ketosteroid isomerase-like protein
MVETETIRAFYEAFRMLKAEEMVSYYHPDVVFEDPAFGQLKGERAKNMWRMLCESQKGKNFEVTYSNIRMVDGEGHAVWHAKYVFSRTNRPVHNRIKSRIIFKDGLIIKHTDHFNLHRWARQALGLKGKLLGWTMTFKSGLQKQTNKLLDKYIAGKQWT